ncbi:MAG TPA: YciI family protein [Acidimicrobiales bacterium]|nr:YciI family protein [Acidimicrobiales bacterium]
MKYMLLIHTNGSDWEDPAEAEAMMGEYMAFTQSIVESGELVSGDPLEGPDTATTVKVRGGTTSTTDGPFAEVKEFLAGYYIVDVKDLDRALELAARIPDARTAGIEVRPIREMGMPS